MSKLFIHSSRPGSPRSTVYAFIYRCSRTSMTRTSHTTRPPCPSGRRSTTKRSNSGSVLHKTCWLVYKDDTFSGNQFTVDQRNRLSHFHLTLIYDPKRPGLSMSTLELTFVLKSALQYGHGSLLQSISKQGGARCPCGSSIRGSNKQSAALVTHWRSTRGVLSHPCGG